VKRLIILILIFICACKLQAQINYVCNGGFEHYSRCPNGADQIRYANYWTPIDTLSVDPICSPEYCNTCDTSYFGVPQGAGYYQYCRSGNGMAIAQMYVDNANPFMAYSRDYLQGKLYKHTTAGKSYCVTFYVVLAELSGYAIDKIGAYIDNGAIDGGQDSIGCASAQTSYTPQVINTGIISDTSNWVKIQGTFVANGTEKFITIGNFSDVFHTDTIGYHSSTSTNYAWYLVDDVSVIESTEVAHAGADVAIVAGDSVHIGTNEEGMPCTWYVAGSSTPIGYSGGIWVKPNATTTYVVEMDLCGNVTRDSMKVTVWPVGVAFDKLSVTAPAIWPNPVKNDLYVNNEVGGEVYIYDAIGLQVYHKVLASDHEVCDIAWLPQGLYIVRVTNVQSGVHAVRKIIKE